MRDGVLLSPLDRRIAERTPTVQLQTILIHSLLFEREVIVPDVYFSNSMFIHQHIKDRPNSHSLLEVAIQNGVVRPALREDASSFEGILGYLRRENVFGLLTPTTADYLATRLDMNLDKARLELRWPERMAESYERLVSDVLSNDSAPGRGTAQIDRDVWAATGRYRVEGLELARQIANERPNNYGIRRADLLRAVALQAGVIGDSDATPTEDQITTKSSPESAKHVGRFITWIDELYFANQSLRFDYPPTNTSSQKGDIALVADASDPDDDANLCLPTSTLEVTVDIPTLPTLLRLEPRRFLELREHGLDWYARAHTFVRAPSDQTRMAAESALEDFAAQVRAHCRWDRPQPNPIRVAAVTTGGAVAVAAGALVEYAMQWPPLTAVGSIAPSGAILCGWLRKPHSEPVVVRKTAEPPKRFIAISS